MRHNKRGKLIGSVFLIALGVLLLFNNFQIFGDLDSGIIALAFGAIATLGFSFYFNNPKQWWILFPSAAFLGLTGAAMTEVLSFLNGFEAMFFFFGLSTAFWLIFMTQPKHWWAGIPAGILTTLGFVATIDEFTRSDGAGNILFLGLGLTFAMLWALRKQHHTGWAKWPAMLLMGIGLFAPMVEPFFEFGWPLVFIALGTWLIWKNLRPQTQVQHTTSAPSTSTSNGTHQQNGHHHKDPQPPQKEAV